MKKENKYICIWYSWGDIENPVEVPAEENAFEYMLNLAFKEARIELIENLNAVTITANDECENDEQGITLKYHSDGEYCYYKIFDNEEQANAFYDGFFHKEKEEQE